MRMVGPGILLQQIERSAPIVQRRYNRPMLKQRTIKELVRTTGVGLHSGRKVELTLRPAAVDTGIVFRRVDLDPMVEFPSSADVVGDTRMASVLVKDNARVSTVEHLMSAFAGMGVDNALVELSAGEMPVMDGSANAFVQMIRDAGVVEQDAPRRFIRVLKTVRVGDDTSWASLSPADEFEISFNISFPNPILAAQSYRFKPGFDGFEADMAPARTFCLYEEIEFMWNRGLAKGGSLENAVVVRGDEVMNPEGLRFDNEGARHKALDALGDLFTAGMPLIAHFHGERAGHRLNNEVLKALFADETAYCIEEAPSTWQAAELVDAAD